MKRRWKVLITAVVVLGVLLAVNTVVLDSETKPAGPTEADGEIVELSSVDLQVVDQPAQRPGSAGAPIVLLHCYACSLRWWDPIVPLLNRDHRVIRIDLIGFGGSAKPKSGYSIPEQARAVAEAMNGLDVEASVLVGHSMGGAVAAEVAATASELVDRVAVLGTSSSAEQESQSLLADLTYAPVLGEALWRVRPDALIRRAYEVAFAPGFDYEAAFDDPNQVVVDNRAMTYTSYDLAAERSDEYSRESSVAGVITAAAVPLLAIFGAEDQILDVEAASADFEGVPGGTVRVFDGVGHSPMLEAPDDTAELLLRFAGGAPPQRQASGRRSRPGSQAPNGPGKRARKPRPAATGGSARNSKGGGRRRGARG